MVPWGTFKSFASAVIDACNARYYQQLVNQKQARYGHTEEAIIYCLPWALDPKPETPNAER